MLAALLIFGGILEGVLYVVPSVWKTRRWLVGVPLSLTAFASVGLALVWWNAFGWLILLVGLFRVFNHLRVAEGRMHERYLLKATRRTGVILGLVQVTLLAAGSYWAFQLAWSSLLLWTAGFQAFVAFCILLITWRNIYKSQSRVTATHYSDKELPTLSVAIPARNETDDLEACLRSVLASNYPKLELLVLDDCSQDKTAEVIRSFAHDGVRFVQGYEPEERWLAKNQAYDKLADEASGELILFCGVDVRFGPDAIRSLVSLMLDRKKAMISVLPRRLGGDLRTALIQPMRYWWELALPRRYVNRPPVLSTCWAIRRDRLQKLGGFEAVQHAIIPEGYFARELINTDEYSFVRASQELDVQTEKNLSDQYETAIRMHYPQIRRRPEIALLLTTFQLGIMLAPFLIVFSSFWYGVGTAQVLAGVACLLLIVTHVSIMQVSSPTQTFIAVFNLPFAAGVELVLGFTSMIKYEFSTVDWKDRNVCIPVMHVVPHLPPVDEKS